MISTVLLINSFFAIDKVLLVYKMDHMVTYLYVIMVNL